MSYGQERVEKYLPAPEHQHFLDQREREGWRVSEWQRESKRSESRGR